MNIMIIFIISLIGSIALHAYIIPILNLKVIALHGYRIPILNFKVKDLFSQQ